MRSVRSRRDEPPDRLRDAFTHPSKTRILVRLDVHLTYRLRPRLPVDGIKRVLIELHGATRFEPRSKTWSSDLDVRPGFVDEVTEAWGADTIWGRERRISTTIQGQSMTELDD